MTNHHHPWRQKVEDLHTEQKLLQQPATTTHDLFTYYWHQHPLAGRQMRKYLPGYRKQPANQPGTY